MIKKVIAETLNKILTETPLNNQTEFRTPLIGYAKANNPLFRELKTAVSPNHLLPADLLPEAKTVAAFFLPFTKELIRENRQCSRVAKSWAIAYIDANRLIDRCCSDIAKALSPYGIKTVWQKPTHNFDPEELCAHWSHKHVAYICGLGDFGFHHMLITPSGCAGRFGSLVLDYALEPSPQQDSFPCKYFQQGTCLVCTQKCPSGALTPKGLDNQKCYSFLLETDALFDDLGVCDACGKCAVWGPCSCIEGEGR